MKKAGVLKREGKDNDGKWIVIDWLCGLCWVYLPVSFTIVDLMRLTNMAIFAIVWDFLLQNIVSVVTKDIPDYAIVGGNPASVIKSRREIKSEEWSSGFFVGNLFAR